jgi:hypothetical protein
MVAKSYIAHYFVTNALVQDVLAEETFAWSWAKGIEVHVPRLQPNA